MDTAIQALFKAMLLNGWTVHSAGSDAYGAVFGVMHNYESEIPEILSAFSEITDVYGVPYADQIVGNFIVTIPDTGAVQIEKIITLNSAYSEFARREKQYTIWKYLREGTQNA